jgi:hypothetical protein
MRTNDARRLDHATLEAMRERAVRRVQLQDGENLLSMFSVSIVQRSIVGWRSIGVAAGGR